MRGLIRMRAQFNLYGSDSPQLAAGIEKLPNDTAQLAARSFISSDSHPIFYFKVI